MKVDERDFSAGTPGALVRARRETLDWSVEVAAHSAGVAPVLWRSIEEGSCALPPAILACIAATLGLPAEVLALAPELSGPDTDPRARRVFPRKKSMLDFPPSGTAPAYDLDPAKLTDLIAGKNSTVYGAHSYHTKVPPDAIRPFIKHYTRPGDLILDVFCGSGMTGVAAIREGRHALLSDLSPAAVHIASNYCSPCDQAAFSVAAERVVRRVRTTMEWLYQTEGLDLIEYTVWSDVFRCPHCSTDVTYWAATYDAHRGVLRPVSICPACGKPFAKDDAVWVGEEPVELNLSVGGRGGRRVARAPTNWDRAHIRLIDAAPIPYWFPRTPFGRDREMWRGSHGVMGIDTVDRFFTRRNLHALAAIRDAVLDEPDERLACALMFAFTAAVNRASKRYQWNVKRPTNVMTGTLYIASLRYEFNVLSLFKRKVAAVRRYYEELGNPEGRAHVRRGSATDLSWIPNDSVDYVFTDPPFGANIYYADSSLLWEAWLGEMTDQRLEAVVNRKRGADQGGKDVAGYQDLLTQAFGEVHRVLKPGRYASVVFNNTDDRVWGAIQSSLRDVGLAVRHTSGLDKAQRSIKGVKGEQGKEKIALFDVIVTVQKRALWNSPTAAPPVEVQRLLEDVFAEHLARLGEAGNGRSAQRRTEYIRDLAVRALLARDIPVRDLGFEKIEEILGRVAERRDAGWYAVGRSL